MADRRSKEPRKRIKGVISWKEFERLVARIEECLAPTGAVVKSPDWVESGALSKGGKPRKRQVDASIRLQVGSAPVLITVETRKRKFPQDVQWIEQVATKKQSIGASVTIAVSSAGFSDGAKETAARHGILPRQLSEVTPADIRGWVPPLDLVHFYRHAGPVEAEVRGYADPGDTPDITFAADVQAAWARDETNASIFTDAEGRRLSVNAVWLMAQSQHDFFQGLPTDGTPERRTITLRLAKGDLRIVTTSGPRDVHEIVLSTELSIRKEEIPLTAATIVEYASVEKPDEVHQRIEFTTKDASLQNFRVGVQSKPGSNEAAITIHPITTSSTRDSSSSTPSPSA